MDESTDMITLIPGRTGVGGGNNNYAIIGWMIIVLPTPALANLLHLAHQQRSGGHSGLQIPPISVTQDWASVRPTPPTWRWHLDASASTTGTPLKATIPLPISKNTKEQVINIGLALARSPYWETFTADKTKGEHMPRQLLLQARTIFRQLFIANYVVEVTLTPLLPGARSTPPTKGAARVNRRWPILQGTAIFENFIHMDSAVYGPIPLQSFLPDHVVYTNNDGFNFTSSRNW